MTILDEEIASAVESSVGSNDSRIEKDTLFIFGGASLVLFGAGMILSTPLARRLLGQFETGKLIPLKKDIDQLYELLGNGIDGYHFDFYVLSAAPVEIVQSALEGIVPRDHIFGTEFKYDATGRIERIDRATAGYGKVARLEQLQGELQIGPDHIIYAGDGSSDMHAMLHVNGCDGLTIAVSQSRKVTAVAQRTVMSNNALAMLVPILEKVVGWSQAQIRDFFERNGFLVQEWEKVRTDWLTLSPAVGLSNRVGA